MKGPPLLISLYSLTKVHRWSNLSSGSLNRWQACVFLRLSVHFLASEQLIVTLFTFPSLFYAPFLQFERRTACLTLIFAPRRLLDLFFNKVVRAITPSAYLVVVTIVLPEGVMKIVSLLAAVHAPMARKLLSLPGL